MSNRIVDVNLRRNIDAFEYYNQCIEKARSEFSEIVFQQMTRAYFYWMVADKFYLSNSHAKFIILGMIKHSSK